MWFDLWTLPVYGYVVGKHGLSRPLWFSLAGWIISITWDTCLDIYSIASLWPEVSVSLVLLSQVSSIGHYWLIRTSPVLGITSTKFCVTVFVIICCFISVARAWVTGQASEACPYVRVSCSRCQSAVWQWGWWQLPYWWSGSCVHWFSDRRIEHKFWYSFAYKILKYTALMFLSVLKGICHNISAQTNRFSKDAVRLLIAIAVPLRRKKKGRNGAKIKVLTVHCCYLTIVQYIIYQ